MPGLKLTLPTVFTDASMPVYYPDSRMNKGSLLLMDFSHPDCQIPALTTGTVFNNIAWKNAQKIIPAGTQTTLSPSVVNNFTPGQGIIEITQKKGLHGIVSQTNDTGDTHNLGDFLINFPSLITSYMLANIGRGFFISVWDRKTRLALANINNVSICLGSLGEYVYALQTGTGSTLLSSNLGNRGNRNSLSNQVINAAFSQKLGNPTNSGFSCFRWGSVWTTGVSEINKACSQILYQLHIIDLTSAGLTYAQADALDLAAWNIAFGAGGRFEGDTFTNPATLP